MSRNYREGAADARAWAAFLRPLLAAVPNPPGREDFAARCEMMAMVMSEVSEEMLSGWRKTDVLRRFKFFPSPAEMWEWFAPDIREVRQSRSMRARLAGTKALPAPPSEPKTAEAIAAVRTTVQAFMAERNVATAKVAEEKPPNPAYLSDGLLLQQYEIIIRENGPGAGAARLRADVIRRRLAAQTEAQPQQEAAE